MTEVGSINLIWAVEWWSCSTLPHRAVSPLNLHLLLLFHSCKEKDAEEDLVGKIDYGQRPSTITSSCSDQIHSSFPSVCISLRKASGRLIHSFPDVSSSLVLSKLKIQIVLNTAGKGSNYFRGFSFQQRR